MNGNSKFGLVKFLVVSALMASSALAVDPDASAIAGTVSAAFATVGAVTVTILGFRKVVKLVRGLL